MVNLRDVYMRYLACCNDRRFFELAEFVHDPIRFGGEMTPLADYARTIASNIEAVPDFHWEIQDLVTDGSSVGVRLEDSGTPQANWLGIAPSGRSMRFQEFAFYRFQDSKIAEMWFMLDIPSISIKPFACTCRVIERTTPCRNVHGSSQE